LNLIATAIDLEVSIADFLAFGTGCCHVIINELTEHLMDLLEVLDVDHDHAGSCVSENGSHCRSHKILTNLNLIDI
jgi:hypothetical protein